jgi:peptide chain release factor 2
MYGGIFDLASKEKRLGEITDQIDADPNFWLDQSSSAAVLKEKKALELAIAAFSKAEKQNQDLAAALELAADAEEFHDEAETLLASLDARLTTLEIQSLLAGELDNEAALLTINAGAGGTESCDWASMLLRMYLRFAEKKGWESTLHDCQDGEEAGVKNATIEISGEFAFGLLKAETGVHRLVRISPFDSNARRHTSFASIYVTPVISDDISISINPADLRIDTYRASGSGGQHVNRTDSAVRITHKPTNTVVQCQSQRSQHQNKDTAMKMLRSKLYDMELEARRQKQQSVENAKADIAFGSQIRSYVLHPYKLVKDHRTNLESHEPDEVLDGDLEAFITAFLQHSLAGK